MSRLCSRLRKLEAISRVPPWRNLFSEVEQLAISKLSAADRELLPGAMALTSQDQTEAHRAVWSRWEEAFAEAVVETGCPMAITAADMML